MKTIRRCFLFGANSERSWEAILRMEKLFPKHSRFTKKMYTDYLRQGAECWVYEENRHILGCVWHLKNEIISLTIDEVYQGQGIGAKLLKFIINRLNRRHSFIKLDVRPSSIPALRLYVKLGFVPMAWNPNYYRKGDGALHMIKLRS